MKLFYQAVFSPYGTSYTVEFPDLPGCITQGDSLEEAFEMAKDAACGWILTSIEAGEDIPSPTRIKTIESEEGFVNYVILDIEEYAKQYSTKAVKKTLTIPEWLNRLAERQEVNFSQELQNALKVRLGLSSNEMCESVTIFKESANNLEQLITTMSTFLKKGSDSVTSTNATSNKIIRFPVQGYPIVLRN